jgi:two-component system, cell cycle sensor histidine kinase and response regulator CckA
LTATIVTPKIVRVASMSGEAKSWLEFLSEATSRLSASLDYNVTLDSLAQLTVPQLADWCDILMLDDAGVLQRVSIVHSDPARIIAAEEHSRRYPYEQREGAGVPQPLIEGAMLFPQVTDELLQGYARHPEELEMLRKFAPKSIMLLPLVARQRRLGLMVLASAESGRIYDANDLRLAEELAARASLAVDNARLYAAEQQARALAESALKARIDSERQMHAILDHSPALIYVSDLQGRLVLVNREYEKRTGLSAAELIGTTVGDLLPPEQAAALAAHDRQVSEEKLPVQFELVIGDGEAARSYFSLKFPLVSDDGEVTALCGIATDITARKLAEQDLLQSKERFEKVFRASTIGIIIVRLRDSHIVDVNAATEQMSGYSHAEMVGKTTVDLGMWVNDADRVRAMAALQSAGIVRNLEAQLRDRQGRVHDVLMTIERLDLAGEPCHLSMAQDITELKQLNARLERVNKMEALGRLAGGIAHDFNNILTAINGYSRLVLDAAPPSSSMHASAIHIERAAARAAGLTQQLLVFGRQQVKEPVVVDLNAAVRNLLAMLRRLIDEDVQLQTTLDPKAGAVEVDPAQLEQVILNLTLNARDAMPHGGRLHIATAATESPEGAPMVRLTVEDTGVGIDEETRARIFEPFFTTKDVGKGTGLGLATVYGIVTQLGGRISVQSERGQGARFDVLLPRSARDATTGPAAHGAGLPRGQGQTLLVVEDDESVCEFVCLVLRGAGYLILAAGDGDEALRISAAHVGRIDLLLTDIVMPNRNGRSLAELLRASHAGLRIMYMSGYPGDTLQRYESIPAGDAFLQKPFTREELFRKVADVLAHDTPPADPPVAASGAAATSRPDRV